MAEKSKYPVQFKINDGEPTEIAYLSECTCNELQKIAKLQLMDDQIKNYIITIIDDVGIEFKSDDDELEDAFDNVNEYESDDDDLDILDEYEPLMLNIELKPKNNNGLFMC